jgi:hypothetical protein
VGGKKLKRRSKMREFATKEGKIYANFQIEGVAVAGTVDQYFAELESELAKAEKECRKTLKTTAVGIILSITAYILHFFLF